MLISLVNIMDNEPQIKPVNLSSPNEFIEDLINKTKEDIIKVLPDIKELETPGSGFTRLENVIGISKDFISEYERLSKKKGVYPPIKVYVTDIPNTGSILTKSGESVIFLSVNDLKKSPKDLLFTLSHEIEHIKNGDTALEKLVIHSLAMSNERQMTNFSNEFKADKGAAIFCDPSIGSDTIRNFYDEKLVNYTIESFTKRSDGEPLTKEQAMDIISIVFGKGEITHPLPSERIKEMDALPKNSPDCFTPSMQSSSIISEDDLGKLSSQLAPRPSGKTTGNEINH